MIININRWVYENRVDYFVGDMCVAGVVSRPLLCRSGLSMSVQASRDCFCSPRRNEFPYYEFEVGFPTFDLPELRPYKRNNSDVYSYVPVEVIEWIVRKHGGIVNFHQFLLP